MVAQKKDNGKVDLQDGKNSKSLLDQVLLAEKELHYAKRKVNEWKRKADEIEGRILELKKKYI